MTPERFGKYEVLAKIGEGGFGTVYRGRDPDLKRPVAIKTISAPDAELRERFLREAEIAAGLQHAHITTVFDFGAEGGRSYLVQEYLPGEDLDRVIARRDPVSEERRLDWLIQIAEALHYAHGRDIVHRDVKPGNMRVVEDGRIKIMDFGIAKLLSAEDQLTRTGMTLGTAGYLPPEQLRGEGVDRRADVFSFGVLAYELLAYQRPFDGENISAVLYRIAHEEPPPLPAVWPDCPERLGAVVGRCLAKAPEERYPDLAPVIAELQAARSALAGVETAQVAAVPLAPARLAPTVRAPPAGSPVRPDEGREGSAPAASGGTYRTAVRLPRRGLLWAALGAAVLAALALGLWAMWPGRGGEGGEGGAAAAAAAAGVDAGEDGAGGGGSAAIAGPGGAGDGDEESSPATGTGLTSGPETGTDAGPGTAGGSGGAGPAPVSSPPPVNGAGSPEPAPPRPPSPPSPPPAASSRFLLVVSGEPASAARTAEGALLRELTDRGHDAIAPDADLAAGDRAAIAGAGRRHGARAVVVGTFQGEAQPSVGRFFTGRAVLELRVHDARTGRLLGAGTVEVGTGGGRGELAPSELAALTQAATEAGRRGADEVLAQAGAGEGRDR